MARIALYCAALLLVFSCLLVSVHSSSCKFEDGEQSYDFSDMTWTVETSEGKDEAYYLSLCGEVKSDCKTKGSAACFRNKKKEYFSLGLENTRTVTSLEEKGSQYGYTVTFQKGSDCGDLKQPYTSVINVICEQGNKQGDIASAKIDNCIAKLTYAAEAGCPISDSESTSPSTSKSNSSGGGGGGIDGGWIFIIIVVCVFSLYLAAGIGWNYTQRDARGLEMCPNIEFWKALPNLVKDGCLFTLTKVTCGRIGDSSTYSSI